LADGTTVELNTDTALEVDYQRRVRRLRLLNGEAVFEVARDPERPFAVYAGETVAQALGTAFIIRLNERVTELAVIEGAVEFSKVVSVDEAPESAPGEAPSRADIEAIPIVVRAGQALTSQAIPTVARAERPIALAAVTPLELRRRMSWTEGMFDFSDTSLEDVVDQINRHNRFRVEIADASLRELEFGGMFPIGDTESLWEALEELGIEVERVDAARIVLKERAPATP
ncbi:MAG: FecR domain-containing protein, partial [Caulobacterales bacterium]|nr:FecR domain-containing protein [Caulobacterales bacterium]